MEGEGAAEAGEFVFVVGPAVDCCRGLFVEFFDLGL